MYNFQTSPSDLHKDLYLYAQGHDVDCASAAGSDLFKTHVSGTNLAALQVVSSTTKTPGRCPYYFFLFLPFLQLLPSLPLAC